jgi:hypothetical protein
MVSSLRIPLLVSALVAAVGTAHAAGIPTLSSGNQAVMGGILSASTSYSPGSYNVERAFDRVGTTEFASAGAGNNTFVAWDFGRVVRFDMFSFQDRVVSGNDRTNAFSLTFSNNSDFSSPISTQNFSATAGGDLNAYTLSTTSARYVRYNVTDAGNNATGNPGAIELRLSTDFSGMRLANPTISASSAAFAGFPASNILDNSDTTAFAANNVANNVANAFVTFDFGVATTLSAIDYIARNHASTADNWTLANLTFSNNADLSSPIASFGLTRVNLGNQTQSGNGTNYNELYTFNATTARYVRFQIATGSNYAGGTDIVFYGIPEPATGLLLLAGLGTSAALRRRRPFRP